MFGILGGNDGHDGNVSMKVMYDDAFSDAYENGGYMVVGHHKEDLEEAKENGFEAQAALYESLPQEVKDKENFTVIPDKNAHFYVKEHVIGQYSENSNKYQEIKDYIKERHPEEIDSFGDVKDETIDKIAKSLSEEKLKNSKYSINGRKVLVEDGSESYKNIASNYFKKEGSMKIKNSYDKTFANTYATNDGYSVSGFDKETLEEAENNGFESQAAVYKALPERVKKMENFTVIPDKNAHEHVKQNVIGQYGGDRKNYEKIVNHLKTNEPGKLDSFGDVKEEELNNIAKYISSEKLKESEYSINGRTVLIENPSAKERDWVSEYYNKKK